MPAKSKKQFGAMAAAANGDSTLGISPSVGKSFVKATPIKARSDFMKGTKIKKPRIKGGLTSYKLA